MKKQVFRAVGSICAAGIMGFSAVCMSGCTFWETWRDVKAGVAMGFIIPPLSVLNLWALVTGKVSTTSRLEIVTSEVYVGQKGEKTSLWNAVDREQNSAEVVWYKNMLDWRGEGYRLAEVDYSESVENLLKESDYWLPLPMPENAKELVDLVATEFEENGIDGISVDGVNGYWYYCRYPHFTSFDPIDSSMWLYDLSVEEFDFAGHFLGCNLSWYDTDTNRLYWYDGIM